MNQGRLTPNLNKQQQLSKKKKKKIIDKQQYFNIEERDRPPYTIRPTSIPPRCASA